MRKLLFSILTVALIASACSPADEGGDVTTTASGETTTTEAPGDTTTTAAADVTTTLAETTTTSAPAAAGGPSCIVGDWVFGSEQFVEVMRSFMTESEMAGADVQATDGTYTISFAADGTYTGVREDWGFAIAADEGMIVVRVSGEEAGVWSADDSTITVTIESSDAEVSASVESDGQSFQLPDSPVPVPEAIAESSGYQCDSDTLTVTTDEATFELDRA